jgi:hypothetical protein
VAETHDEDDVDAPIVEHAAVDDAAEMRGEAAE